MNDLKGDLDSAMEKLRIREENLDAREARVRIGCKVCFVFNHFFIQMIQLEKELKEEKERLLKSKSEENSDQKLHEQVQLITKQKENYRLQVSNCILLTISFHILFISKVTKA